MREGVEALRTLGVSNAGLLERAGEFPVRKRTRAFSIVADRMYDYLVQLAKVEGDTRWKMMLWRMVREIDDAIKLIPNKRERDLRKRRLQKFDKSLPTVE
jgi:signal recognition particle receptor subunit beta